MAVKCTCSYVSYSFDEQSIKNCITIGICRSETPFRPFRHFCNIYCKMVLWNSYKSSDHFLWKQLIVKRTTHNEWSPTLKFQLGAKVLISKLHICMEYWSISKWRSWNFNTFMTNVYHIPIDCVSAAQHRHWRPTKTMMIYSSSCRFYCPSQNKSHNNKFTWAYTFGPSEHIAHRPSSTIYCLYWIRKRWIALRFIALIVDSIWWIYCISKQNKMRQTKNNNRISKPEPVHATTTRTLLLIDVRNQES